MGKFYICPHAPKGAVQCETKTCAKCGWNPDVAEARLEAIKSRMAEEEVAHGKGNAMG